MPLSLLRRHVSDTADKRHHNRPCACAELNTPLRLRHFPIIVHAPLSHYMPMTSVVGQCARGKSYGSSAYSPGALHPAYAGADVGTGVPAVRPRERGDIAVKARAIRGISQHNPELDQTDDTTSRTRKPPSLQCNNPPFHEL